MGTGSGNRTTEVNIPPPPPLKIIFSPDVIYACENSFLKGVFPELGKKTIKRENNEFLGEKYKKKNEKSCLLISNFSFFPPKSSKNNSPINLIK